MHALEGIQVFLTPKSWIAPFFLMGCFRYQANQLEDTVAHIDSKSDLTDVSRRIQERIKGAALPKELSMAVAGRLSSHPFTGRFVAVRSSGADEDSASHSFAGQFDTLLYQCGFEQVVAAIRHCWASCFAERVMVHRRDCGLPVAGSGMAVIVQVSVHFWARGHTWSFQFLLLWFADDNHVDLQWAGGSSCQESELL